MGGKAFEVGVDRKSGLVLVEMPVNVASVVEKCLRNCQPLGESRTFIAVQALGFHIQDAVRCLRGQPLSGRNQLFVDEDEEVIAEAEEAVQ